MYSWINLRWKFGVRRLLEYFIVVSFICMVLRPHFSTLTPPLHQDPHIFSSIYDWSLENVYASFWELERTAVFGFFCMHVRAVFSRGRTLIDWLLQMSHIVGCNTATLSRAGSSKYVKDAYSYCQSHYPYSRKWSVGKGEVIEISYMRIYILLRQKWFFAFCFRHPCISKSFKSVYTKGCFNQAFGSIH